MTVAIAWERYVAVHFPIDYNQAMNDANAIRKRLLKYVGPCFVLALIFNIPKIFEAKVVYKTDELYNTSSSKTLYHDQEESSQFLKCAPYPIITSYWYYYTSTMQGIKRDNCHSV